MNHISEAILLCSQIGKETEDGSAIEKIEVGIGPTFSLYCVNNKRKWTMDWSESIVKNDLIRLKNVKIMGVHFHAGYARINKLSGETFAHLDKCAIALSQLGKEFKYQKLNKTLVLHKVEITNETINHLLVDKTDSSKSMSVLSKIEDCEFSHISEGKQMFAITRQRKWDS